MAFASIFHQWGHRSDPTLSSFSLTDLIAREDWKLAEMECTSNPYEAKQWKKHERFFDGEHSATVLPIHQACGLRPPRSMIETLYDVYPEGIAARDVSFRRTPLHVACQCSAPLDVIELLLELYSEASRVKDKLGRLPIHYACSHGASPEVIAALLTSYPESSSVGDHNGWLPIHIACRFGDDDGVIRQLVESYPACLHAKTKKGNTPLSCAKKVVDRKHEHIIELLQELETSQ